MVLGVYGWLLPQFVNFSNFRQKIGGTFDYFLFNINLCCFSGQQIINHCHSMTLYDIIKCYVSKKTWVSNRTITFYLLTNKENNKVTIIYIHKKKWTLCLWLEIYMHKRVHIRFLQLVSSDAALFIRCRCLSMLYAQLTLVLYRKFHLRKC